MPDADLELGLVPTSGGSSASGGFSVPATSMISTWSRLSLGEKVTTVALIAPTLINWLVLAEAHWLGTVELVDSDGVPHIIARSHTKNFQWIFCNASVTCVSTVFAHMWLTMGAIARRNALDQAGAVGGGEGYAARLERAEAEAGTLSTAEWAHLALVGFDFCFAGFVVFPAAANNNMLGEAGLGILPGAGVAFVARCVLAPARAAVLHTQRTNSIAFAGGALCGSMAVLMVQIVVLARFAAFAVNYPTDLFHGDCAFSIDGVYQYDMNAATNDTWRFAAPIATCASDLFVDGVVPDSNATVYRHLAALDNQINGSLVVIYYLLFGSMLYYAARGQGLMHDKLFTELDMIKTHVIALLFWLLASVGAVLSLAVMWAEWGDQPTMNPFKTTVHACAAIGLIGMMTVLWNEAIREALGFGADESDMRSATHIIFASMRFINGQPLPEAIQLREALKKRNVYLKIVELTAGADINQEVFESIEQAEAFLVFGTSNYGEKTANPACTYFESEYARNSGKMVILLRMIPWEGEGSSFQHMQARVMFGMNDLALSWMEETPMPENLPDDIIAALPSSLSRVTAAEPSQKSASPARVSSQQVTQSIDINDTVRRLIRETDRDLLLALKEALAAA